MSPAELQHYRLINTILAYQRRGFTLSEISRFLVLQRQTKVANLFAIDVGHARVQQLRHLRGFKT